jgi:intracellular sulfur oxidation DsrE/DsrF family protein
MSARAVAGRARPLAILISVLAASPLAAAPWPAPVAPVAPHADGYVVIPGVAVAPERTHVYRAVFNATLRADHPTELLPALNMLGSELNAIAGAGLPLANAKFVMVVHGDAIDGILDEAHYKAKFGVSNPNLKTIADIERAGAKVFVCGQNLAFAHIDPATLTKQVTVASDALIVLMKYQNDGYALMSF